MVRKTTPDNAKKSSVTEAEAVANRELAKKRTGIIGWSLRAWMAMNAAISTALTALRIPVVADSHPAAGASIRV